MLHESGQFMNISLAGPEHRSLELVDGHRLLDPSVMESTLRARGLDPRDCQLVSIASPVAPCPPDVPCLACRVSGDVALVRGTDVLRLRLDRGTTTRDLVRGGATSESLIKTMTTGQVLITIGGEEMVVAEPW